MVLFVTFNMKGQMINTVAGGGSSGDGSPATMASINNPHGGVFDKQGNLYFVQSSSHIIRKVNTSGIISTFAGSGVIGYGGDGGQASVARLKYPNSIAIDTAGNIFITDAGNYRIRKVDVSTGIITTVVGTGVLGFDGDGGLATAAKIHATWGIVFDKYNNMYFSDVLNHRIRKVATTGIISTIAGIGISGFSGDGGPATNAQLSDVMGLCFDTSGNLFLADYNDNNRIRKIDISGIITTVAGNGVGAYNGDGLTAISTQIDPLDIRIDKANNAYFIDHANSRIRKINSSGIVTTVAGTGISGYNGDGIEADTAKISNPGGLAIDACDNIYFGDIGNVRFRKIAFNPFTTPTITITVITAAIVGATVTVNATITGAGGSYLIYWYKNATLLGTTSAPSITYTKTAGIDTITATVIPAEVSCAHSAASNTITISSPTSALSSYPTANAVITIFPNPATSTLHIAGADIGSVIITNLMGQLCPLPIKQENGNTQVNVTELPPGVYFIKVNDWYVQRFLKE